MTEIPWEGQKIQPAEGRKMVKMTPTRSDGWWCRCIFQRKVKRGGGGCEPATYIQQIDSEQFSLTYFDSGFSLRCSKLYFIKAEMIFRNRRISYYNVQSCGADLRSIWLCQMIFPLVLEEIGFRANLAQPPFCAHCYHSKYNQTFS